LRIEAFEYGYEHADTVPSGLTRVRLVNRGGEWHEALLARLADARAFAADYADSARAGVDFPAFARGFGGPSLTVPDDSTDIIINLIPGRYAIVCWFKGHLLSGMISDVLVVDHRATDQRLPQEATTLTMLDYAFALSAPLAAGRNVIRVENRGAEIHEVDVFRLNAGISSDALVAWQAGDQEGEAPGVPVGGTLDVEPGDQVWVEVDLEPGRYVLICTVPAPDGQPHAHKGMVLEVEVGRSA
jgi:uncharacterized cupredoxin-like copper-binding protein